MKARRITTIFRHALLIVATLATIGPLYFVLATSIKTNDEFYNNLWLLPSSPQFSNYVDAWTRGNMGTYLFNSLKVVSISVFLIILLALPAGYALARLRVPGRKLLVTGMAGSLIVPNEITLIPLFTLMASLKFNNTHYGLIFVYVGWSLALATYIFRNFFLTIPEEIVDAARIDGCGEVSVIWHVIIPLSLPAVATAAILNSIFLWGEFLWVSISVRSQGLRTLPFGLFTFQGQTSTEWGLLSAGIAISIIPLVMVFIFSQRYFLQGLTAGAIKS
jgi:raffinose/stachyose/melibiose transport system permease protein